MKFDQFAYWLQGYFELGDHFDAESLEASKTKKATPFLTITQVQCVKSHIQLHFECVLRENEQPEPFICWLEGSLNYYDKLPVPEQANVVREIRERLNNLFIHKIDPQMPGDKDSLQDIHDGKGSKEKPPKRQGRGKALERRGGGSGRDRRLMC
jgi:hypothetical protein